LKERITHSFYLKPLTPDEVSDYLRHRLQAAGCPAPQIFSKAAENLIAKASGGLTRRINILADKAMLAAYSESATATRPRSLGNQLEPTVTVQHVKAAIQDSDYKQHVSKRMIALGVFVAVIVVAVIVIMAWMLIQQNSSNRAIALSYAEALTAHSERAAAPVSETSAVRIEETALVEETVVAEETSVVEATTLMADTTQIEQVAPLVQTAFVEAPLADTPQVELTAPAKAVTLIATAAPAVQSAPTSPVAANTTGKNIPPILAERMGAFDAWTSSNNLEGYTLRILSVGQDESAYLTDVLQQLDRERLLPETYACQLSSVNGQFWQLYFGTYDSVSAARAGIRRLPARIRNNQPFAQNVARIGCLTERG